MRLCGTFNGPFRQLANEADVRFREQQAQREGDLVDCNAGNCQHQQVPETITVTSAGCQPVWDDMKKRLYAKSKFPSPLPDQLTIKDSLIPASLPMLLLFGGAVGREWATKD